jgi:MFS family permease
MPEPTSELTGPLWRDRNFATYWSGQSVSQLGDRVSELAVPLIAVTTLHGSPTVVGLLTAAVWAPHLVSLFVGAWVDHQPRKQRLLISAAAIPLAAGTVWAKAGVLALVEVVSAAGVMLLDVNLNALQTAVTPDAMRSRARRRPRRAVVPLAPRHAHHQDPHDRRARARRAAMTPVRR